MKVCTSRLLLLFIVLVLQGCIGAMVIGTTAVATKIASDPRTLGTQIDDSTLKIHVANALAKDQRLKKEARIVNTTYQSKVLLTGQVPNIDLAKRAKKITMSVNGVTEVYNEIRHGHPVSLRDILMDTWITIKIRSQLLARDVIRSTNMKITTENGEVFLLGLVNYTEGKVAAEIASKVRGVKHVITAFTYISS